ncbi:MAG: Ig-like domain-containing protein [Clostridiales bacterium]|nr:Ig-like domain-containing protein [Clostridiales bacterium]
MGRKLLSIAIGLIACLTFACGCSRVQSVPTESGEPAPSGAVVQAAATAVTMRDIADFLSEKDAHYPLSDEFIERYQQASGGYIDLAKKTAGMIVDKEKHEPNQKWHFFDSWLYPSIDDGSFDWDASAKTRVYSNLLCPELLLWIYEASGVDPAKVRAAKDVAEQGRATGVKVATIAKNMRACVPWEDIENSIVNFVPSERVTLSPDKLTLTVGESGMVTATVTTSGEAGNVTWSVTQGEYFVTVTSAGNVATVTAVAKGTATVKAECGSLSAECAVTVNAPREPSSDTSVVYEISGTTNSNKALSDESVFSALKLVGGGDGIITGVSTAYIYGGGSGGSGDNKWSAGNMFKVGTASVAGSITFTLNTNVSRVIITGYVNDTKCQIRVGDSTSTDWTDDENDGKTVTHTCTDMTVIDKDALEAGNVSTITLDFESTSSVTIATINTTSKKYPLYITAIEFVLSAEAAQ